MTDFPTTIKMMPYSQRPTWLGIEWTPPSGLDVDRYELYLCPKNINNNEIEALLTGAKEQEGVVKVVLPPDVGCAVDNMTPQGKRTYYTVFAVGKDGSYVLPSFKVNDAPRMDLKAAKYLKEPYAPVTLKVIPYGQKPGGIGVTWTPPDGDWAGFKVVVITGKNISKPEEFERLFAGELDFARLYDVPAGTTEAIDDASPEGSRNYYSVVAVDKKGNMVQVEGFKTVEASGANFTAPLRLSGKEPAAPAPGPAPTKAAAPAPLQAKAPAAPTPKAPAPMPAATSKYPARISPMPSTQHLYGSRIRLKEHDPSISYKVLVASKSIPKAEDAIEGRLEYVKAYDIPSDKVELVDNVTEAGARCYYVVLGQGADGNFFQVPIEVNRPGSPDLGGAGLIDPGRKLLLPTVDSEWLLRTGDKGVEIVPGASGGTQKSVGYIQTQPWEGQRVRITGNHENFVRYQFLVSTDYIMRDTLPEAAQGRIDKVRSYDIPLDALELINNLHDEKVKGYYALLGWDKEGSAYFVDLDFPTTFHADFHSPRFIDPLYLDRVKAAADAALAQGRAELERVVANWRSLSSPGVHHFEKALEAATRAHLVYPMYDEVPKLNREIADRNGWLYQALAQVKCEKLFQKAEECLKGDRQPYAYPDYGGVERDLEDIKKKQAETRTLLQEHLKECPWSNGRDWHKERLGQFEANDAEVKRIEDRMAELRARDAKAKGLFDQAREAHDKKEYDEAIRLYGEVMKVKPEWDTNGDIERARDDKEYDGQVAAAGTDLSKFKAIYDDWMGRGKGSYGWKALRKAYLMLEDKDSFLLYERELFRHGAYGDVVGVWRECRETRAGFLEGVFGDDKVKDLGLRLEETDSEVRRVNEEIRDQRQAVDEVERERMKVIGSADFDYIRKIEADIDRRKRDISRNEERRGELVKRMAIMLSDLFG